MVFYSITGISSQQVIFKDMIFGWCIRDNDFGDTRIVSSMDEESRKEIARRCMNIGAFPRAEIKEIYK